MKVIDIVRKYKNDKNYIINIFHKENCKGKSMIVIHRLFSSNKYDKRYFLSDEEYSELIKYSNA